MCIYLILRSLVFPIPCLNYYFCNYGNNVFSMVGRWREKAQFFSVNSLSKICGRDEVNNYSALAKITMYVFMGLIFRNYHFLILHPNDEMFVDTNKKQIQFSIVVYFIVNLCSVQVVDG